MKNKYVSLGLVALIVFSTILQLTNLGNQLLHGILLTNTLDLSWQTDSIERLLHGYLAGRDFIFTYGPLFQVLYTIPATLFYQPSYLAVLYAPVFLNVFNILLLFVTLKFATKNTRDALFITIFLFFIIGAITYDPNALFRILIPFTYGMLLLRFVTIRKYYLLQTTSILFLPAFFGLYTFDLFILNFMLTILFIGYETVTLYKHKSTKLHIKRHILTGILYILIMLTGAIGISFLLSHNFNYLLYSFDTVTNYQLVMSIPWSYNKYFLLLVFPLGLCWSLLYIVQKLQLNQETKKAFIMVTLIALLQIKSAFIRTDDGHIIMGIYPSILVLFTLFYYIFREQKKILFIALFLGFYLLIPLKSNYLSTLSLSNLITSISPTDKSFFSLYKLSNDYYYKQYDFTIFQSLITKNPGQVMIYPYDSYILNIYGQTYNTFALQFYQYSDSPVEEKTVDALRKTPPKFIILGIDNRGAVRLDNIPNFSRNPLVAKWMLTNYSVYNATNNYLILQFNPNKNNTITHQNCTVYDIDARKLSKSNIFELLIKPSTYYLNNIQKMRLPYTPNTQYLFIINDFDNYISLKTLFETKLNFDTYQLTKKTDIKIIKKLFTKKLTVYTDLTVKCY